MSFLDRGRSVPTMQMGAPPASDMGNSAQLSYPQVGGALGDQIGSLQLALQGRVSLTLLAGLIVGVVVFYMWTRDAQGS